MNNNRNFKKRGVRGAEPPANGSQLFVAAPSKPPPHEVPGRRYWWTPLASGSGRDRRSDVWGSSGGVPMSFISAIDGFWRGLGGVSEGFQRSFRGVCEGFQRGFRGILERLYYGSRKFSE